MLWRLLILWNLVVFAIYGYDKWCAVRKRWRVSEVSLLLSAGLLGAPGALVGMIFWRHKIRKPLFLILVPLALLAQLYVLNHWR